MHISIDDDQPSKPVMKRKSLFLARYEKVIEQANTQAIHSGANQKKITSADYKAEYQAAVERANSQSRPISLIPVPLVKRTFPI